LSKFEPRSADHVLDLVKRYPLACLVSMGAEGSQTSMVPLLALTGPSGTIDGFLGHLPLSSPHVSRLKSDPQALVLFQGPDAYISPHLVSKPHWGPTWNFTLAGFDVAVSFHVEETDHALRALTAHMERDHEHPWTVEQMGARYRELAAHVIAFRAEIKGQNIRFKHGQDETPAVFDEIIAGLNTHPLAEWMVRTVRGRD